ncbi:MAG: RluA family pseudouridine synthase [Betaproteobacteria bacterium]|nr:RluA family pseudouridine synthase [Betaproteobacteria bacterium]
MNGSAVKEQAGDYIAPDGHPVLQTVPPDLAGQRLDQALARMFPEHSRSRLVAWLRQGYIRLDARTAKPSERVWGGERVSVLAQPEPSATAARAEAIDLNILYEDEAILVLDKPAGLVVHPGSGNWQGTMLNALLHHEPGLAAIPRAGIVHRLDKDTSGLLVVAKSLPAHTDLVRQLQERTVARVYLALAYGGVEREGIVEKPIGRDPRSRIKMAVVPAGKPARTGYRVLRRFAQATLLECSLATGRTHQIRVHMHSLGHPLVGDPVYRLTRRPAAAPALAAFGRQALHAARLSFIHPVSRAEVSFESPLPADMRELIAGLK